MWLEEKRKVKLSGLWRIIPSASSSVPHFVSYLSDRVWMELWFYLSATKRKTADEEGQKSDVLLSRLSRLCLCDTFLFNFLILNLGRSLKRSQIPFPSRLCFVLCFFFSLSDWRVGGSFQTVSLTSLHLLCNSKPTNLQSHRQSQRWRRNNCRVLQVPKG